MNTLDLVLSNGLPVVNLEICDAFFSDHLPVLFEATVCCQTVKPRAAARRCQVINPSTAARFTSAFSQNCVYPAFVYKDTEALNSWFLETCQTAIDFAAPLKARQHKNQVRGGALAE